MILQGFVLGLATGMMMGGGHASKQQEALLSQIPMRCIYVFDHNEKEYRVCRFPSLRYELFSQDGGILECRDIYGGDSRRTCQENFVDKNIQYEIEALREIKEAASKQK